MNILKKCFFIFYHFLPKYEKNDSFYHEMQILMRFDFFYLKFIVRKIKRIYINKKNVIHLMPRFKIMRFKIE